MTSFFDWVRGTKPSEETTQEPLKTPYKRFSMDDWHIPMDNAVTRSEIDSRTFKAPSFPVAMDADDTVNIKRMFSVSDSPLPDTLLAWYANQSFIGYQTCALLSQHWLINKACTVPGRDATRNGWKVQIDSPNDGNPFDTDILTKQDKRFNLDKNLIEYSQMLRVFGVRIALFDVASTDPKYYENPFNIDGVTPGSYKGIVQVDPYWCAPLLLSDDVYNPASRDFYEPQYWQINGKKYHRSHLIVTRYSEVPDILKPAYFYGGVSLTQMIYERVYCAERTANEAPQLALTKRMNVRKTELERIITNPERTRRAIEAQAYYRDNYGQLLIGKDDEYEQHETSLADLDSVIMTQYQLVAAVANVPVTELLGTTPKGFNATGEFEKKSYDKTLRTVQRHELEALLLRHYQLLAKSMTGVVPDLHIVWNPSDEPTENERADVNLKKAQYYSALRDTGAISGDDIGEALVADPTSGFETVNPDEGFDYGEENGEGYSLPDSGRETLRSGIETTDPEHV